MTGHGFLQTPGGGWVDVDEVVSVFEDNDSGDMYGTLVLLRNRETVWFGAYDTHEERVMAQAEWLLDVVKVRDGLGAEVAARTAETGRGVVYSSA